MEKELAEIRKEVIESRNLVIKTDNLLKNLHADLKVVSKRQEDIARRGWVGSAAAYLLFAALALAGSAFWANVRLASAREATKALARQVDDLDNQVKGLEAGEAARKAAMEQAAQTYGQIADGTGGARLKAVESLAKLDRSRLSPLESRALDDRARALKAELAATAFDLGKAAFRHDDMKTAAAEIQRYLTLTPDAPDALQASFMLGNALHALKDYAGAVAPLQRFVEGGKGHKNQDYAALLLGQSLEANGNHAKAVAVLRRGIDEHPSSEFVPQMRRILSQATRAATAPSAEAPRPAEAH